MKLVVQRENALCTLDVDPFELIKHVKQRLLAHHAGECCLFAPRSGPSGSGTKPLEVPPSPHLGGGR